MVLYKLTNQDHTTYAGCRWGEGVEHHTSGKGKLCGPGWLHAYTDPLLAVLLNPMHAEFDNPVLWEAEGDVGLEDHGLKVGCTRLKTLRIIDLPEVSIEQRVSFGILCALEVCSNPAFVNWAEGWLVGRDSSWLAAKAVVAVLEEAAEAAKAAWSAVSAAKAAVGAAEAAPWTARSAAEAVEFAAEAGNINLITLARKATISQKERK